PIVTVPLDVSVTAPPPVEPRLLIVPMVSGPAETVTAPPAATPEPPEATFPVVTDPLLVMLTNPLLLEPELVIAPAVREPAVTCTFPALLVPAPPEVMEPAVAAPEKFNVMAPEEVPMLEILPAESVVPERVTELPLAIPAFPEE